MSASPLFTILAAFKHNDTTLTWLVPFSFGLMCAFIKWWGKKKNTHTMNREQYREILFFVSRYLYGCSLTVEQTWHDCERDICALHLFLLLQPVSLCLFQTYHDASCKAKTPRRTEPVVQIPGSNQNAACLFVYPTVKLIMRTMHVRFVVPDCGMPVSFIPIIGTWTKF